MLGLVNNPGALNAQHNLGRASSKLNTSIERLSSGLRINRGADGPAALVISEKQRAQIAGLRAAIDNTDKAVAVVQTAEGALSEINNLLVKIRSLAIDSANSGVNDDDALAANQAEIANALETIDRIAANTQFGEKRLLNGSAGIKGVATSANVSVLKVGTKTVAGNYDVNVTTAAERATVSAGTNQTQNLAAAEILTINGVAITLDAGLNQAGVVSRINEFTAQTGVVADVNAGATRLRSEVFGSDASLSVISNVAAAADSSGFGVTLAQDSGVDAVGTIGGAAATGTGNVLQLTSGNGAGIAIQLAVSGSDPTQSVTGAQGTITVTDQSLIFQIGANSGQSVSIAINSVASQGLGVALIGNQFNSLSEINVTSASGASDTLALIDAAINEISNLRGTLGAFQGNTLESTASNMRSTLENTVNAESVIRDTDFAREISNFTNSQVLVQAGTAVLSSANQSSQLILSLLR
ncbi:MAG TPA: flagellin [Pirellulaceae bacterium]|nr:flagellin [Pirellulaceae bacterium]HMO91953.1 flagellin [Pirellulaceae bacterium]HMP68752.1 flagellin [Pirellulaceae bacterium]